VKIYTRHVLWSFLGLLLLCLSSALVIFMAVDFVGNSKVWLARPARDVYVYYLNFLPHILYLTFPVALLLASVFSVGNMARHLELVALRAAGVSVWRILTPILLCGALAGGGMFWFEDAVLPDANYRRFQINEPKTQDDQGGDPLEKFNYVYTASDGKILFFDYYSGHRKTGQGVTVISHPKGQGIAMRIDAKSVAWDSLGWVLREGMKREFKPEGLAAAAFKELRYPELRDAPADLLDDRVHPDEMSIKEIDRRIAILKRSGETARVLETQRHFRFSSSLVNLLMVIIGAAMSVHTIKTGLARNFGIALLITFLYYVALRLGLVMGENGTLSPEIGAWFGNLLFAPLALILMWRAARI
jgi:lipopolysaccharide export system permease protein